MVEGGLPSALLNPAGLTGIWAEENTRDALFLAYAAKDALGANLDRIQIVKCWTARGMLF